jgi:acyl-homoserine lactone acylase PvdQ
MILKIVKYTFISCLSLLALLFVGSFLAGLYFGRDIEAIEHGQIKATRDAEGIWSIEATDKEILWHSFGFVQSQDRYFQIELTRHAALGRLSEIFGDESVNRDRLTRVMAGMALRDFSKAPKDGSLYLSAAAFASGVNEWRTSEHQSTPVEFRVMGLKVEDLPEWQPWHVYAISVYQAWVFSYDLADENRQQELLAVKGKAWVDFFDGREVSLDGVSLYEQKSIRPYLKKPKQGFSVSEFLKPIPFPSEIERVQKTYGIEGSTEKTTQNFPRIPTELQLGASNAWIAYSPKRNLGPILCNDPHLNLMWPSSLYPIKYSIGDMHSVGWMLPGQPFLVMGAIDNAERSYAWGITLANYANTQDRVYLSEQDFEKAKVFETKIRVRDTKTYKEKILSFEERWTPRGPVGSDWFESDAGNQGRPWAIDWVGFRGAKPPYAYFLEQNFDLSIDTPNSVAANWQTPVVNKHWISKIKSSGKSTWGHIVSGMIFSSTGPKISTAQNRSYYSSDSSREGQTFLSSANQQIWSAAESRPLAKEWGSPLRAAQIKSKQEDNFNTLGFSQVDDHSKLGLQFVRWARQKLSVTRLCSEGTGDTISRCQQDLSTLDSWDGSMDQNDWRPSLVSLWSSHLKWKLWVLQNASVRGSLITTLSDREMKLFVQWARSGASQKLLWDMTVDASFSAKLKAQFNLDLGNLLQSSFTESFSMLENSLGMDRKLWSWANLHRVAWQHPMLRVLGPNLPFVGPPVSGSDDSPQRSSSEWDPRFPLLFPVVHGAVQRTCFDASGDKLKIKWTGVSGPSGNPFSKWSKTFSNEYFFKSKWVEELLDR